MSPLLPHKHHLSYRSDYNSMFSNHELVLGSYNICFVSSFFNSVLGLWNHHLYVIVVLFFNCHVVSHWLYVTIHLCVVLSMSTWVAFHFGLLIIRLWWTLLWVSLCRTEALISIGYNTILIGFCLKS